jgi:hypothetical protein
MHTNPPMYWAWALLAAYAFELGLGGALFLWALFALLGFIGVRPVGLCGLGGVFSIRRSTSSSRFS